MTETTTARALEALQATVDELLDPPGCEWNRAQTHRSLVTYLVEESFELVEAIEDGTVDDLREELGDVLYQVVLHAGIAERAGEGFALAEVMTAVDDKIRRRHPHVFGSDHADGVEDIVRLWSAAKAREKAGRESEYDGVPVGLPALARAQKIEARRRRGAADAAGAAEGVGGFAAGEETGVGGPLRKAASEEEWGRALLAEVDAVSSRGWDAERALRTAVREREAALREAALREAALRETALREAAVRDAAQNVERRGTPQPE